MRTIISGTRLGQYEVVGPLGSGGMGDVYRARDTRYWLAYRSTESGKNEVYIQRFPITGEKTRISTDTGTEPTWSRDGHELFYEGFDSKTKKVQMWEVDIDVHTGSAGKPHMLFEGDYASTTPLRNYDVAADGRFAFKRHVNFYVTAWHAHRFTDTCGLTCGHLPLVEAF